VGLTGGTRHARSRYGLRARDPAGQLQYRITERQVPPSQPALAPVLGIRDVGVQQAEERDI